jgi:hypothetical protein
MKKIIFVFILVALFVFSAALSMATTEIESSHEENMLFDEEFLARELLEIPEEKVEIVNVIEIGVETREIRIIQNIDDELLIKNFPAATASVKNTIGLPFEKKGQITKIVFNPTWTPTKNIRKENVKKFGKELPKVIPPGKNNPLGIVKLFITYPDGPNDLGIHNTNEPRSIGKRVSHGCNRLSTDDALELAGLILEQGGYDSKEIIRTAKENRKKTLSFKITDGPDVYYKKK